MSKKIKDTEYLYLSSMLAARSAQMLTRERMERMLDAPSFEESAKLLEDCGYVDMSAMNASEVEQALSEHRGRILGELAKLAPAPALVDIFRLRYDYHNAKVVIKAAAANLPGGSMLSAAGRVPADKIQEAYNSGELGSLPNAMAKAIGEAGAALARTDNPQVADILLDKACYAEMAELAGNGSAFLQGYVRFLIDSVNLRTAVRVRRIEGGMDFLKKALLPGGSVDADRVAAAAFGGELGGLYSASPLRAAGERAQETIDGGSLAAFEQLCEKAEGAYLDAAALVSFGEEPVMAYIARLEKEITSVRMILTGLLAGMEPDRIRERLGDANA